MTRQVRHVTVTLLVWITACSSPSAPSPAPTSTGSSTSSIAVGDTVVAAIDKASGGLAATSTTPTLPTDAQFSTDANGNLTVTSPCPGGGSRSMTLLSGADERLSSGPVKFEMDNTFTNCQSNEVTLNGRSHSSWNAILDPSASPPKTTLISMSLQSTMSFVLQGVEGRMTADCTTLFGAAFGDSKSTGSMSWEYPLGSTPMVRSCGLSSTTSTQR